MRPSEMLKLGYHRRRRLFACNINDKK